MRRPLPVPLTSLIGRENELAALENVLRDASHRLVTITGPGGIGKTRLALELAHRLDGPGPAPWWWVSLASVSTTEGVAPAMAAALDIEIPAGQSALAALQEGLAHRDALIVIDNFEQVSEAAPLLSDLLQAGPSLRIVVTSRSVLNLSGEYHLPLAPLRFPETTTETTAISDIDGSSAVRLFVERAHAATGSFTLTPQNATDVVTVCRGLDGLPLAIELAAARLRHLPLTAMVARLGESLPLLVGGPRDRPARHQTLFDAIDWSYRLLPPPAQQLFRRLAALPTGASLETARMTGLSPDLTEMEILGLLALLVDDSLLVPRVDELGEPRYAMLETIRQYGLWQLQAAGERDGTYHALSRSLTDLAERARQELGGPQQKPWIDRLDTERANIRAICDWAIQANEPDIVLRLGAQLWRFWLQRSNLSEGRDLLQRALDTPGSRDDLLRADAVYNLGNLAFELHDYARACNAFTECLEIWESIDDRDGVASAHNGLGLLDREAGSYDAATARFHKAAEIWRDLADTPGVAITTANLGVVALSAGKLREAETFLTQDLAVRRDLEDIGGGAHTLLRLGQVACLEARQDDAQRLFRQSLEACVRVGNRRGETDVLYAMAQGALLAGEHHEALRLYHDALAQRHARAERDGIIECVEGIAAIAAIRGNAAAAVRLLTATAAYRASIGAVAPFAEQKQIDLAWAAVRERLDHAAITEAQRMGQALSLDDLAIEALRLLERPVEVTPSRMLEKLSAREQEVFSLLTQYLTDREIGERLFLSHRTVERHVGSILEKLGVKNRREAAALGAQRSAA